MVWCVNALWSAALRHVGLAYQVYVLHGSSWGHLQGGANRAGMWSLNTCLTAGHTSSNRSGKMRPLVDTELGTTF